MISVVILNWNGIAHLETCFSSLLAQSFQDFEVILVDNGSTDGSVSYTCEQFPTVRILPLETNKGFCAGNNAGIEVAKGDLIALLNNDMEVSPYWLENLYKAAREWPDVGLFASKILLFNRRDVLDAAGDEFHAAGFASKRGWMQFDAPEFHIDREVFGACGGAALYRRSMLNHIGLLDEDFWANGEDVDLSFRAQLQGYKCRYVSSAQVYHKGGATIGQTGRWFYLMRRNQLWIMIKNMPAALLFKYSASILIYNVASLLYHSARRRTSLIWQAYVSAMQKLPLMLKKRRLIQSARVVNAKYIDTILTKGSLMARAMSPVTAKLSSTSYSLE